MSKKSISWLEPVGENSFRESHGMYYEDFGIDETYEHRPGRTVTETDNIWQSLMNMNTHPLHIDNVYAEQTEFGRPLVSSLVTLSIVGGLSLASTSMRAVANLGWKNVTLPHPVFVSDGTMKDIITPQRIVIKPDNRQVSFGAMPAVSQKAGVYVTKIANFIGDNAAAGLPSVHSLVNVFSAVNGQPLAVMEGGVLTNAKCAAITGYFADIAAPDNATILAVIGSGVQAKMQVAGILAVRDIKHIKVFSKTAANGQNWVEQLTVAHPNIHCQSVASVGEAVEGADIISTATSCATPLFEQLNGVEGVHVSCIGAHTSNSREVSRHILENATILVEDKQTAIAEAGDIHQKALDLVALTDGSTVDLKAVPTVFSSTGHGSLDLITACNVLARLKAK
jgi:ornithine cyclodeaminase/alanine dehydrogenase-like protein (mu-crystallin family)